MELDEFRLMLENSSVDLWTFIDTAISVAIRDHENELLSRRDAIVEKLNAPLLCKNCNSAGNYEDLETKIIRIKKLLENPNQVFLLIFILDFHLFFAKFQVRGISV